MYIKQSEIDFLESIFQNQNFYHSTDVPFSWHYVDNGLMDINTNLHLRAQLMYSERGFFMDTLRENNEHTLKYENVVNGPDQCHFHRQRRYMIQQYLDNDGEFAGPVHISIKPKKDNLTSDDLFSTDRQLIYNNFTIITHPGHTRLEAAGFLQSPIKNAIITINKEHDYGEFLSRYKRIENPRELKNFWKKPTIEHLSRILEYDEEGNPKNKLLPPISEIDYHMIFHFPNNPKVPGGAKYHSDTECFVLKLWGLYPSYFGIRLNEIINRPAAIFNLIKTSNYLHEVWESSKDISKIIMEKKLCIYTNGDSSVKEYLLKQRRTLWRYVVKIKTKFDRLKKITGDELRQDDYVPNSVRRFEFDVVVVDEKPKNISELNDNKGFAIWIDKSRVTDIKREIYELLFFARHDIKKAKTSDEKIEVINCNTKESKEWIIPEEYFK